MSDSSNIPQEVRNLCDNGRFDRALQRLRDAEARNDLSPNGSRALNLAAARLYADIGKYCEAATRLKVVLDEDDSNSWLEGSYLIARYRHAISHAESPLRSVQEQHLAKLEERDLGRTTAGLLCAHAQILTGIHPDLRPRLIQLDRALKELTEAENICISAQDDAGLLQVRVTRAKTLRSAATFYEDLVLLERAKDVLRQLEVQSGAETIGAHNFQYEHVHDIVHYERGRLALLDTQWRIASDEFNAVLKERPGHQAAIVWLQFAEASDTRKTTKKRRVLRRTIDEYLGTGGTDAPQIRDPDAPRIRDPDLIAELNVRAADLSRESLEHDVAINHYRTALRIRPLMSSAIRGLSYCHQERGDVPLAEALLRIFQSDIVASGDVCPPEITVDLGRIDQLKGHVRQAEEKYELAIRDHPLYAFGYEALSRLRMYDFDIDGSTLALILAVQRMLKAPPSDQSLKRWPNRGGHERLNGPQIELDILNSPEVGRILPSLVGVLIESFSAQLAYGHCDTALRDTERFLSIYSLEQSARELRARSRYRRLRRRASALLARVHFEQRRFEDCIELTRDYVDDADMCELHALSLAELGRYLEALDVIDGIYERLNQNHLFAPRARIVRTMARILRALGQSTRAALLLKRELDSLHSLRSRLGYQPFRFEQARLSTELGWTTLDLGNVSEADDSFDNALAINQYDDSAVRGKILARGQHSDSITSIEHAARSWLEQTQSLMRPQVKGAVLTDVGRVYVRRGMTRQGYTLFEEANTYTHNFVQRTLQVAAMVEAGITQTAAAQLNRIKQLPTTRSTQRLRQDHATLLLDGLILLDQGRLDESRKVFRRLYMKSSRSEPATIGLAVVYIEQGDYRQASSLLGEAPSSTRANAIVQELRMWVFIHTYERLTKMSSRSNQDEARLLVAREHCAYLRYLEPSNLATNVGMGFVASHLGTVSDAATYFTNAISAIKDRLPSPMPATRVEPRSGGLDLDTARSGPTITEKRLAGALRDLGALQYKINDLGAALASVEEAMEWSPFDSRAALLRGVILFEMSDERAIAYLRRARALDPTDIDIAHALAVALDKAGAHPEAVATVSTALDSASGWRRHRLHLLRAQLYYSWAVRMNDGNRSARLSIAVSDVDDAKVLAEQYRDEATTSMPIGLSQDDVTKALANTHYYRGIIFYHRRDRRAAREALRECADLDPDHEACQRALTVVDQSRFDRLSLRFRRAGLLTASRLLALLSGAFAVALGLTAGYGLYVTWQGSRSDALAMADQILPIVVVLSLSSVILVSLRRLRTVSLANVLEFTLDTDITLEHPIEADVEFSELPLLTIVGPSAQRSIPFYPDTDVQSTA